jgi:hypothetical protein
LHATIPRQRTTVRMHRHMLRVCGGVRWCAVVCGGVRWCEVV